MKIIVCFASVSVTTSNVGSQLHSNITVHLFSTVSCATQANVIYHCPNETTTAVIEDFCTFSCAEGYELQGSNNGTCLANGSWSQGNPLCVLICPAPLNGQVDCGTGNNCIFSCDPGYILQGNITSGVCESNRNWSGGLLPSCEPLSCPNRTGDVIGTGHTVPPCQLQYQSQCTVSCDEGFTGDNVTYMCDIDVRNDPTTVTWIRIGGNEMCERSMYVIMHLASYNVLLIFY